MGTQASETYELSKITKIVVYFRDSQIVFHLRILLISEVELTLFNFASTTTYISEKFVFNK